MIKQICLYCKAEIALIDEDHVVDERVSHGVCPICFPKFVAGSGKNFSDFLSSFTKPIFLIDQNARVIWANELAKNMTKMDLTELEGSLYGEIFECTHATLGTGCGTTIHCKSCTIRQTIEETAKSGKPCYKIPAYMDLGDQINQKSIQFFISTQKAGEVLLLQIEKTNS